ncbi:MAG TPA: dTMP kinase [Actinophytocola sp.]|uniref:dTMP kinase n=1 Tax=Actinophytocola sp. TaxID=1872138 RepID=UPI002DC0145B|nr:dTMP kinase [Actinophytocola sp.]HEU5475920.1 dTMP kinase [Actinophytocola sp.]
MGRLIVIEGLDGAGKRTLADKLTAALAERGASVERLAFPRYGAGVHADLIADALHGRLGDLGDSVYGMAALFALDRQAAAGDIRAALTGHDVVLLDRYVASNAAYGAARLGQDAGGGFVAWVRALEIDRLGLPLPDLQLLLRVPPELAAARSAHRERTESDRERDTWEADDGLQARCAAVYDQLAADTWLGPWRVVDGSSTVDFPALAELALG